MATQVERLHSAARRYCMDQYKYWVLKYFELQKTGLAYDVKEDGWTYTEYAYRTYPRYIVLNAILRGVEEFVPQDFSTIEEARETIVLAGYCAENIFTERRDGLIVSVMNEERKRFASFIEEIPDEDLNNVEILPYRRALGIKERRKIWDRLRSEWSACPYPTARGDDKVILFQETGFLEDVGGKKLQPLLKEHGIERIWELKEDTSEAEYEMALDFFEPHYSGVEAFWCSEEMDWIVWVFHERAVGIGGWLLEKVKLMWPNWRERAWQIENGRSVK